MRRSFFLALILLTAALAACGGNAPAELTTNL